MYKFYTLKRIFDVYSDTMQFLVYIEVEWNCKEQY